MMRPFTSIALLALALAACSQKQDGDSADDFAARLNGGQATGSAASVEAPADATPVNTPPPAGVDATAPEKLGNIAGADLGQRDGGCTFQAGDTELLIAGAPLDPAAGGKGVVRLGGKLYVVSLASGGKPAVLAGGTYTGPGGISVNVVPGSGSPDRRTATMTVSDAAGKSKSVTGEWVCA